MVAWIARCGGEVSIKKLCNRDKLGNRKSMVCDSGMMDVEGMRVYTCTPPIGGQA